MELLVSARLEHDGLICVKHNGQCVNDNSFQRTIQYISGPLWLNVPSFTCMLGIF